MAPAKTLTGLMLPQDTTDFDPAEFIKRYEETYKASSNRSGFKTKKSFAPSKLGYDKGEGICPRYWYIAFSGAEFVEDVDSASQARMDHGSYSHERIQANIEKMGILREKELEITSQDPPIRGFVDAVIEWNDELPPVEIKTANADNFTFRVATGKPTGSHYVQFIIYLKLLKARWGFLLYENKDTQELAIIKVTANPKTIADVDGLFDWMRLVYKAYQDQTLPKKPWTRKNAAICKSCPVRKDCFEKFDEGVVQLPILEVPKP